MPPSAPPTKAEVAARAAPFDLGAGGRGGVLCLHGLTGTPYEVRPLGEALAQAGFRALGPALPGHGSSPEALARVGHEEWVEACRAALLELRSEHAFVATVGLSLGGLLTLLLAAEGRLDAAVAIGTPLRLRAPLPWLVPWLRHLHPFHPKGEGSDIREPGARARHPSYDRMPLAAVAQLLQLQRRVRAGLAAVRAPLLVAHGALDRTADPADADRILRQVASERRRKFLAGASGHVVPVDYDSAELSAVTVDFLEGCLSHKE